MATLLSTLVTNARTTLLETSVQAAASDAPFWTDAELLVYAVDGVKELWRKIIDLHQGHFVTSDVTNVSQAASATTLTGVPADVFRVELIEMRDRTTANTIKNLEYLPRAINHPDFSGARGMGSVDPNGRTIYYAVVNAGAPVAAPSVEVAPAVTSALLLRFVYTPVLAALTASSTNPIPGESDHAIQAWIIAHARAKEREDRSPDPAWLAIYASDSQHMLTALTPRQTQEPDVVEAVFESYWS